ncbi:MAG: metallopeptidase family protein [Pseudomonadota bacterium]|nr:MAG: hypothetical protein DIU72_02585 [Pseudomonadota bacterium]
MLNTDKTRKLNALLSRADELIEEGHLREALEVARKARDLDPRPEVLCLEGGLLAELGEVEGAISVFESVLDRDRDNLEAMGALADLLIYGGSGEPEEVERGLALCRRAMKLARGDEELQAELSLLEGIALSGLGAYAEALGSLERAQKVLGEDPELLQELGIVLFHLWRFDDARKVFERLLEREPHAAHALHYMGVLEERRGNRDRADEFFRRAHETDPETIPLPYRISPEEFDRLVEEAISELPGKVRRYLSNVAIAVEDYPQESQFGGDETVTPSVLGVFTGSPLGEKGTFDPWSHFPNNIILFQRNLENSVGSREELVEEIGITLLHEVGHFLGLDEDELRERDLD